jgi:hypothetical protein
VIDLKTPRPYVVRFNKDFFFCGRSADGTVKGSPFSSVAVRLTYAIGCEVCECLRELGFEDAVVTNIFGFPVIPTGVVTADLQETEEFKEAWAAEPAADTK